MTIGQFANKAGVGVETVRFYERKGLIETPARRSSGYREYDAKAVARLRFIRSAKDLGFTLAEIADLLSLRVSGKASCSRIQVRTEKKLADIENKIRSLRRMKRSLLQLVAACECRDTSADSCAVLMRV